MFRSPWPATIIVSAVLLIYNTLPFFGADRQLITAIFLASPFLVAWMVLNILKAKQHHTKQLDNDEWGYADKNRDELGLF
jgi:cytochrome c oxidase assembly factor CtaG